MSAEPVIEHRDIDAGDGLSIHVASSGASQPLILLHGFTGSSATWNYLRSRLDSSHRVIAIDLPGHGRSSSPLDASRYSLDRLADDLVTVLDALDLTRVALFGYSMGGRAALRFAIRHPDRLTALILESTSPGIEDQQRRSERIAADNALAELIEKSGIEAFVSKWEQLPIWESQAALPEDIRRTLRTQRLLNEPRGLANSLRGAGAGVDPDVLNQLHLIAAPTLLLAGELDSPYVAFARRLQSGLPHAEVQLIPKAGHAAHLENPDAVIDAVADFLRRQPVP
ncbi:MAG TPA: 2-succinyl-6-hydroxy-2,4-cyclohexadiene-1-carboxylate synthase [Gemmatimonadaceae bacterium]|nr:2-succinyl-6-hydroxy-2,4-cyclohexadiene-1-carboxylate synthase [Gemmatimonadaceae bacterium]